ncbi:MAG: hypothetical protein ACR2PZ_11625 [Pseudomonadales bacterium]
MPYSIEVDRSLHRVWFRATGIYAQAEAFQSIQDMVDHPDFLSGDDVLVDMTEVEEVPLLSADILKKVEFDKGLIAKLGTANWAFVTPTDLLYGFARMYQSLMDDAPIQVEAFRDLEAAVAWLDSR